MKLTIETIPHQEQAYPTTGDWYDSGAGDKCDVRIAVSDMSDWRMEACIGIHEAIEALICKRRDISDSLVTIFDIAYEDARLSETGRAMYRARYGCECAITDDSEPGDDVHAPYYHEHQIATAVERLLAAELGLSWMKYEQAGLDLYAADRIATE
jgi:hypothetical protein